MINKIDGSISLNIGGENRKIKYNLNALIEVESYLPSGHLFNTLRNADFMLSTTNLVTAVWVGLKYQNKKLTRESAAKWVEEYLQENPINELNEMIVATMGLVGTIGDVSMFKDILVNKKTEDDIEGKQQAVQ